MASEIDIIVTYVVRLKNNGVKSVLKADIIYYMKSIGISEKKCIMGLNDAIRYKKLIELTNGKVSINFSRR